VAVAASDRTALVDRLWESRARGDVSPAWLMGLSLDDALDVQLGLLERRLAAGEKLAGWKVGLTSNRARAALGVDARPFGHVLASHLFGSGARVPAASIAKPSLEPEMCFEIGRRLAGPGLSREQVRAGLARVCAGFELNERRVGSTRPDFGAFVTDGLTQWGVVRGSGVTLDEAGDLDAVHCTLLRDGEKVYAGVSRDELDPHLESLSRLAAVLGAHGRALEPGQVVITGAFARFDAAAGQRWRAEYRGVGDVEVTFT
jgi:2-keto-4-pentenoate hydratase